MVRRSQRIDDFSGGINATAQAYRIDDSQAIDAQNCYTLDAGTAQSRLGMKPLAQVNTSGITITDLYTFRRDDSSELLLALGGGNTYRFNATASAWVSVPSGMSVWNQQSRVNFFQYQDVGYLRDGFNQYKLTGSAAALNFTRCGVSAPSGTLSALGAGSSGNVNGTVGYAYAYVNSLNVAGNLSSTVTLNATSQPVALSSFQTAPVSYGIVGLQVFRTASGAAAYKLVASMPLTANFTDNAPDASLGALAQSDNYPPPSTVAGVIHKDRALYAVKPTTDTTEINYAWFSEIASPELVGATNFQRFGWDGDPIATLAATQDQVLVGKARSLWEWFQPSPGNPTSWYPRKTNSEYGSESLWFAPLFGDKVMFLSRYGIISAGQQGAAQSTLALASDSVRTQLVSRFIYTYASPTATASLGPGRMTMSPSNMRNASGIAFSGNVWLGLSSANSPGSNDMVWVYNYQRSDRARGSGAWWRMSNMNLSAFALYNNGLYAASSKSDAYVYQLEVADQHYDRIASAVTGGTLLTQAIDAYWRSKPFYGSENAFDEWKQYSEIRGAVSAMSNATIRLRYVADNPATFTTGQIGYIDQDPTVNAYGVRETGTNNAVRQFRHRVSAGVAGKNMRVEISNFSAAGVSGLTHVGFKLMDLEIENCGRGRR